MPAESLPSPKSSRRTPGSKGRGALGGDQRDMGPPEALRHGWCCPFKRAEHGAGGEAAVLRSVWADTGPPRLLGPRFRGGREGGGGGAGRGGRSGGWGT